jgi:hypothetical protein
MPEYREFNFFIDDAICISSSLSNTNSCLNNKMAKENYYRAKSEKDTHKEKFDNIEMLYGKEVVSTMNIGLGISLLILYIYYNK